MKDHFDTDTTDNVIRQTSHNSYIQIICGIHQPTLNKNKLPWPHKGRDGIGSIALKVMVDTD